MASTQFQAFQLAFLTMLPSILLSGFMFPFDGMPKPAQWLAQVLPLTHFVEMVRGIVLRGAPLTDLRSGRRAQVSLRVPRASTLADRHAALPQEPRLITSA